MEAESDAFLLYISGYVLDIPVWIMGVVMVSDDDDEGLSRKHHPDVEHSAGFPWDHDRRLMDSAFLLFRGVHAVDILHRVVYREDA